jgi:hypothetical protein
VLEGENEKVVGVVVEVEPKEGKAGSSGSMMERKLTESACARVV